MIESKVLQFPAMITNVGTKIGCYKITIETQGYPPPEHTIKLFEYHDEGVAGWFTFNRDVIQPADIVDLKPLPRVEKGKKSMSRRLREVLYVSWEQDHKGFADSEEYYNKRMEALIDHVKKELD